MLEPPPHFQPYDPAQSTVVYKRNLPHWRQDGATYFVTFRLADSIPKTVSANLSREALERADRTSDEREREWFRAFDAALDQGHGSCILARRDCRSVVERQFNFFNDPGDDALREQDLKEIRYRMGAYVIMGNHAHLLIQPTKPETYPLEKILQGMKARTAVRINRTLNTKGKIWAEESYDRIVRDPKELQRMLQYIGRNPTKAGLNTDKTTRWVHPNWEVAGWKFRGRL